METALAIVTLVSILVGTAVQGRTLVRPLPGQHAPRHAVDFRAVQAP